ncbi:MAG: inner-rane translocator [Deltaproteobacteria bacterium]|jgi:branched-chain amino acid transport system permease protein|nr:inner-rane translocator [Deltaproteobacteria bacterium]
MPIDILFQLLINGVLFGAMYGIAAIGLSLIFGTMRIVFIAQGTMIILAAYGSFWLFKLWGMDPYVSILFVVPTSLIVGIGFYQALFRKVAKAGQFPTLLIAFGLMALLENLMFVVFTGNSRALQTSYSTYALNLFGMNISFVRLMVFVMAIIGTAAVTLFLKKTLLGKAVRAASENLEYAMLVGITPHQVNTVTFAVGMGLAGLAGVATATTYAFDPFSGFVFGLKAMIALALGGMGNVIGALLGGIVLGVVESYGAFLISGGWADVISYAVFLLVLMFKPEGLFSRDTSAKL